MLSVRTAAADDQDKDARVARIVSKVDELNNHRETLKTFMTQPRVDRDVLKQVFNIIRHTMEYELRHPESRPMMTYTQNFVLTNGY